MTGSLKVVSTNPTPTCAPMARLYGIYHPHRALEKVADDPDSTPEALMETMEGLGGDFEQVAKSIACVIKNIEGEAKDAAKAAKDMAARAKRVQARADAMRAYLLEKMIEHHLYRIACPNFVVSAVDNPAEAEIIDAKLIPAKFMDESRPGYLDLTRIATALRDCEHVPGALIRYTHRLVIRQ